MDGTAFGRYRLIELMAQGEMGEVWRAYDTETTRTVAVKILMASLARNDAFQQHFRREAHAAAKLNDPHIVPIHNYGEIDGRLYIDMRLIEGRDLDALIADGPLHPARAVAIVEQVASALTVAHNAKMVHGDVKPANILVAKNDFAYLIDFGIAQATEGTQFSKSGQPAGTWWYLAPELFTTSYAAGPRSDVYALTCVLYQCLTGELPYPGDTLDEQQTGHLSTPPPRPSAKNAGVPRGFDVVIATGMAKEPAQRYQSASDLAQSARANLPAAPRPAENRPPPSAPTQRAHIPQNPTGSAPFGATQFAPTNRPGPPQPHMPSRPTIPAAQPARNTGNRNTMTIAVAILAVTALIAIALLVLVG